MLTQLKLQLILKDVKQADIARAAGVNRAYINRIVLNKQKPSARAIKAFKEVAGISLEAADAKNLVPAKGIEELLERFKVGEVKQ